MRIKRRVVTPETQRNSGTCLGTCVLVFGIVVAYATGVYFAPKLDAMTGYGIMVGIIIVSGLTAGIIFYRRPRLLVYRINTRSMGKAERRFVHRVNRHWVASCRDAGISREDRDPEVLTIKVPRIVFIEVVPLGIKLIVQTVPGQPAEDIAQHSDHLASALGAWFRAKVIGPATCQIIAELRDPLVGVRKAGHSANTEIVIGRCDDGTDAVIDLADASHIADQGMTRSGKSALCYTIFGQLIECDAVRVTGIDPNRVLLEPLAESEATVSSDFVLGADPAAALALLTESCRVMDERARLLTEWGIAAHDHFDSQFRVRVLLLEEYAGLLRQATAHDEGLKSAEKTTPKIKQRVARLVSEGAKAGIRVFLITQRMDASIVDGDSRGQFGTRITMGVDNGDAVRMLHPQASPETVEKVVNFPVGRCLLWQHRVEKFMQADFTPYAEYRERLGLPPAPEPARSELDETIR